MLPVMRGPPHQFYGGVGGGLYVCAFVVFFFVSPMAHREVRGRPVFNALQTRERRSWFSVRVHM
jgi:hypothetical protein